MMKVNQLLFGTRDLLGEADIVRSIVSSKNYQGELGESYKPLALLLFETSKQRTWLVATRKRLYCILDDIRNSDPKVNWSMRQSALIKNGTLKIDLNTRDKSPTVGFVDIGTKHKNWLYSKKLFVDKTVGEKIRELIAGRML